MIIKEELLLTVDGIDRKEADLGLLEQDLIDRSWCKEEFMKINFREEISWRQKARLNWLKGDNNTKFFHSFANARGSIIGFSNFTLMDPCVMTPFGLKKRFYNAFRDIYEKSKG